MDNVRRKKLLPNGRNDILGLKQSLNAESIFKDDESAEKVDSFDISENTEEDNLNDAELISYEDDDDSNIEGETAIEASNTDEDDSLFIMEEVLRTPQLSKGKYPAKIGKIGAEKVPGDKGPWVRITIPFYIKNPTGGFDVQVNFMAAKSMKPDGRLFMLMKSVLGFEPSVGMDLRDLVGRTVQVTIDYHTDNKGNVWESISSISRL